MAVHGSGSGNLIKIWISCPFFGWMASEEVSVEIAGTEDGAVDDHTNDRSAQPGAYVRWSLSQIEDSRRQQRKIRDVEMKLERTKKELLDSSCEVRRLTDELEQKRANHDYPVRPIVNTSGPAISVEFHPCDSITECFIQHLEAIQTDFMDKQQHAIELTRENESLRLRVRELEADLEEVRRRIIARATNRLEHQVHDRLDY